VLGQYTNKLCQITMSCDVGKSHYIEPHMNSARLVNALCCFAFPECLNCVKEQQAAKAGGQGKEAPANEPVADARPPREFLRSDDERTASKRTAA
jgi:hypothetical protein